MTQCNFKDGLVYLDDGSEGHTGKMGGRVPSLMRDGEVRDSKLLWALGNYSRFIRPQMVRVKCDIEPAQSVEDGLLVSAYQGTEDELVLVAVNLSTEEAPCDLGSFRAMETYTTSADKNLTKSSPEASRLTIPARAVATVLLEH